jgi:high-affinity Fe2+/Pb2+ permease
MLKREPVSILLPLANYAPQLLLSSKPSATPGASVVGLIIAVVVGAVIALGGTALVTNVLSSQANGTPTPASSSLYNYGTR